MSGRMSPTDKSEASPPGQGEQPRPEEARTEDPQSKASLAAQKKDEERKAGKSKERQESLEDFTHRVNGLANAVRSFKETTGCSAEVAVATVEKLYLQHCCHANQKPADATESLRGPGPKQ